MARPRSIPDQTIIAEAYELIMEQGTNNLTFDSLGARVGLVPASLAWRFKSKQQLILEVDRYALERGEANAKEAMERTASPIDAIITQFTNEKAFASTLDRFINGEEFLLTDLRHKNLYSNYQISFEHRHKQIAELLQKAQAAGELDGIDNIDELARHLEMIVHGAGHVWAMTQEGPIENYISDHVHFALQSYRKKKGASKL